MSADIFSLFRTYSPSSEVIADGDEDADDADEEEEDDEVGCESSSECICGEEGTGCEDGEDDKVVDVKGAPTPPALPAFVV